MSAAAATSMLVASQHGLNIDPTVALTIALVSLSVIIYLAWATIYFGYKGKKEREENEISNKKA